MPDVILARCSHGGNSSDGPSQLSQANQRKHKGERTFEADFVQGPTRTLRHASIVDMRPHGRHHCIDGAGLASQPRSRLRNQTIQENCRPHKPSNSSECDANLRRHHCLAVVLAAKLNALEPSQALQARPGALQPTKPSVLKPSTAKPSALKPSQAKRSQSKPSALQTTKPRVLKLSQVFSSQPS